MTKINCSAKSRIHVFIVSSPRKSRVFWGEWRDRKKRLFTVLIMGFFHPYFTKKEMKTSNILYVHMQSKLPVLTACLLMADRCPQAVQCAHAYWQKTVDKRAAWQVPRDSISSCGANTGISSQRKVNAQLCWCCHSHHEELFNAFVLAHGSINTRPKSSAKKCISHVFRWVPTSSAVRSLVVDGNCSSSRPLRYHLRTRSGHEWNSTFPGRRTRRTPGLCHHCGPPHRVGSKTTAAVKLVLTSQKTLMRNASLFLNDLQKQQLSRALKQS